MTGKIESRKYRVTRWHQIVFPQELFIDETHVMTRKRHFPAFWIVKEESIPLSKVASIQIIRGLLFSAIIIENSGGPFPIAIKGFANHKAAEIRKVLETYERLIKDRELRSSSGSENPGDGEKKTNKLLNRLIKPAKKADTYQSFNFKSENDEPLETWWKEPAEQEKEVPKKEPVNLYGIDRETWEEPIESPSKACYSLLDEKKDENLMKKPTLSEWMNDLVKRPGRENEKK